MDANDERLLRLGQAIARRRQEAGISQIALSRMLGHANHSHLSRVENGKSAPSMEMMFDIADALDTDIHYFFTEI
ncbi:MAG TPA: transcriptional regulator [Eggerthellaceae bacterium]|nr:transcriptional regulator [Eggerthellaceae bacterium]